MKKVLLISMPFGAIERQALGISLLKAQLTCCDIPCDIRYFTFPFAEFIGYDDYQWMSFDVPYTAFAGDWTFTEALYGERLDADREFICEVLIGKWQLDEASIRRVLRVRAYVPHFLTYCMASIPWENYAIIGFTSTFEQNISSLALAKLIKSAYPNTTIVFGGANWEGEMGCELHRHFPFVDYACSGEADKSFPTLVEHILAGKKPEDFGASVPGLIYRQNSETIFTGSASPVTALDELPIPDYSDYFHDLNQSTISSTALPMLLLETSRGCWWGAKSHCRFCGLNGGAMVFRSKSPQRVLGEIEHLTELWGIEFIEVVDNIIDMGYFETVLQELAKGSRPLRIFYEVKANLNRKHLDVLRRAGVDRIQAGIESMSNHILHLMHKGTTALTNVQLLKWAKEYGISADWNILYNFPGETRQDYEDMLVLLRSIRFLNPPTGYGPIRLDRFSPYFNAPDEYGFRNIHPIASYRFLYPFDDTSLTKIAYYFDYQYEQGINPTEYTAELINYVHWWKANPDHGALHMMEHPDGTLVLVDTRIDAVYREYVLTGIEKSIFAFCDVFHNLRAIVKHLCTSIPGYAIEDNTVRGILDWMIACKWMVTDGKNYLSLAISVGQVQSSSVDVSSFFTITYINGTVPESKQPINFAEPERN
jgi:ribosomal peptide maturation radical SAM protein 1